MSICRAALVAAAVSLASCATPSIQQRDVTPALEGNWGGQHITLNVGTLDTAVEFDCAEGAFFGPYFVTNDGRFTWSGTFTRRSGSPTRKGPEPPEVPATYTGAFRGGDLTLTVEVQDGQTIGPFILERFKDPQLTRCL